MSDTLKNMIIDTFRIDQRAKAEKVLEYIEKTPATYDDKLKEILRLCDKSLMFGLEKGASIEKMARETLERAKKKSEENWIKEFIFDYNQDTENHKVKK